jgi:hypothetical protein
MLGVGTVVSDRPRAMPLIRVVQCGSTAHEAPFASLYRHSHCGMPQAHSLHSCDTQHGMRHIHNNNGLASQAVHLFCERLGCGCVSGTLIELLPARHGAVPSV